MKQATATNCGMVAGSFWGLLRQPDALPVLFGSKRDAEQNRDDDEYLVEVLVRPASLILLGRGERAVLERQRAEGSARVWAAATKRRGRPRIPDEEKRRRGSSLRLVGMDALSSALKAMKPALRRELRQHLDEALGRPRKRRGGSRAAATRVRR